MIKLLEKKERNNVLMNRKEFKLLVEAEVTPSKQEVTRLIASETKKSEDLVVVKKIKSKFGRKTFLIIAFVYDSKEEMDKIEKKKKEKKGEKKEMIKEESDNINNIKSDGAEVNDTKDKGREE